MKLNVPERVILLGILPKEGDFTTLKILRELQSNIGFSEEDHKKYKIETEDNFVKFDVEKGSKEVDIEIGDKGKEIIKEALQSLDKNKKLEPKHFSLYEKFVQEK